MRLLFDECMPHRFARVVAGNEHQVETIHTMGWRGTKNGALLRHAAELFDAFVTVDKGFVHQQNQKALPIAVIVIRSLSNDTDVLLPLVPKVREALRTIRRGELIVLS